MATFKSDYRLRLPGPTQVPERVRQAIALPVWNHRGPEFRAILSAIQDQLKPILGTANPVMIFASSGTGMMEASLINILAPGERVLVPVCGQFGERFAQIARAMGAEVDVIEIPWGRPIDPDSIEKQIASADYRAVIVVHNESSTGVVSDLASIGAVVRNSPALLVIDSVSGLGGLEMRQDEWGIDVLVSASQKALMCPPGIGLASISEKASRIVNRDSGSPRFYWDFRKAVPAVARDETPFTTPVSLAVGLHEALAMIHEEGLPNVLTRHRRLAAALRRGCSALGLESFGDASAHSNTVTALRVPESMDGGDIVRALYERHNTVIAGSRNKLQGRVIRIGTMGWLHPGDILTDLLYLGETLRSLGSQVPADAGGDAAALEF